MINDYTYSKQDILKDTGLKAGTFYNRIKELKIMDNPLYMTKVKENNREKSYFNQRAYNLLMDCQESVKNKENLSNEPINNISEVDTVPMVLHKEIVDLLKQQLEEKDKQILNLQNIIGLKEQTSLVEKQKLLGTHEDNKKWWQKLNLFNKRKNVLAE